VEEPTPIAAAAPPAAPLAPQPLAAGAQEPVPPGATEQAPQGDVRRSPTTSWRPWTALVALVGGLVLAAVAGLAVDLPALALGVQVTASHTPPGLAIADTFVQDLAFVAAAIYCAHIGGRAVRAWQFGLRAPGVGWRSAVGKILLLLFLFVVISVAWSEAFNPSKEKLLQQLGSNESTLLLLLSAGLTCVVAPMCEEMLFRGYIFTALRNWRGTVAAAVVTGLLFGGVHAGSAPVLDLVPLAGLGFGLCLLYRYTGSLFPCMVAHSLNNSIAFASLEGWGLGQALLLLAASLLAIRAIVLAAERLGMTPSSTLLARSAA
jgi:membrane protease YdiL (CAAX protease family)